MKETILERLDNWLIGLPKCERGGRCNCKGVTYKHLEWTKRKKYGATHLRASLYCTKCMNDVTKYIEK